MTEITAPSLAAATVPDAIVAPPANGPIHPRTGPLRSGNPRGNPNLAPRCGAKARRTGCPCQAPAMANGRCRMHGGASTGPRTPKGLADLARAHTRRGNHTAAARASQRYVRTLIIRNRVLVVAGWLLEYLPPDLQARWRQGAPDLAAPQHPSQAPVAKIRDKTLCTTGRTAQGRDARGRFVAKPRPALQGRKAEREAARLERAKLAPWRAAIARARIAQRAARAAQRAARRANPGRSSKRRLPPRAHPGGTAALPPAPIGGDRPAAIPDQAAPFEQRGQGPLHPGTVALRPGPDGGDRPATVPDLAAPFAERGQRPLHPGTVASAGLPPSPAPLPALRPVEPPGRTGHPGKPEQGPVHRGDGGATAEAPLPPAPPAAPTQAAARAVPPPPGKRPNPKPPNKAPCTLARCAPPRTRSATSCWPAPSATRPRPTRWPATSRASAAGRSCWRPTERSRPARTRVRRCRPPGARWPRTSSACAPAAFRAPAPSPTSSAGTTCRPTRNGPPPPAPRPPRRPPRPANLPTPAATPYTLATAPPRLRPTPVRRPLPPIEPM